MTIAERIEEARGLCHDIDRDLEQLEFLNDARNPETSAEYAERALFLLQNDLREHIAELLRHYDLHSAKRRKAAR